jgi:2-(1,2-epoxy-1,2-dihydrophenyl)acetyl-CoA isomerase
MTSVRTDRDAGVLYLTLDRPAANNSLSATVYAEMLGAMQDAERDPAVRVIVTRASGRNFSVGADAGNLDGYGRRGIAQTFDEDFADKIGIHTGAAGPLEALGIGRWVLAVTAIEKPWIASVQGAAAGGGFALSMLHHFRIASETARFTAAFGRLGLGPEMGLSATLPAACGRQKAMDIILSSRLVEAREAHAIGIADRLAAPELLEAETARFAGELAAMAPLAVRATLRQLRAQWQAELRAQLELEWRDQAVLFTSEDFAEGVSAFAGRRVPVFHGR